MLPTARKRIRNVLGRIMNSMNDHYLSFPTVMVLLTRGGCEFGSYLLLLCSRNPQTRMAINPESCWTSSRHPFFHCGNARILLSHTSCRTANRATASPLSLTPSCSERVHNDLARLLLTPHHTANIQNPNEKRIICSRSQRPSLRPREEHIS